MSTTGTGLRLALGTLTIVPVGDLPSIDRRVGRVAMIAAPLAALPLAIGTAAILYATEWLGLPPLIAAALLLLGLGWATRAMHWDGLADTADGLAAGWSRERALEVMRRGDVGPVGAAVLALILLIDAAAVASLLGRPHAPLLIATVVLVARAANALSGSRLVPPARPDGLGATVAGVVPLAATTLVLLVGTAVLTTAGWTAGVPWWQSLASMAVAVGAVIVLLRRCHRVLGGVTGDVMGACIELAQCVLLLGLIAGSIR